MQDIGLARVSQEGVGAPHKAGQGELCYATAMRERIRKRLREYRAEALERIGIAINTTKRKASKAGHLNSNGTYLAINKDNETGVAEYMDRSANFIRHVAPGSAAEYVDELYDGGQKLKQEIMQKTDHVTASWNCVEV